MLRCVCRPFFTYWVTFVQIVCYIVSVAVYGFSPFGISVKTVESEVFRITHKVVVYSMCFACVLLLCPRERLQSIVMSMSVCVSVHKDISGTTRSIFTNFLGTLPMSVAWSFCSMLTIGRIAYWRGQGVTGVHGAGKV